MNVEFSAECFLTLIQIRTQQSNRLHLELVPIANPNGMINRLQQAINTINDLLNACYYRASIRAQ